MKDFKLIKQIAENTSRNKKWIKVDRMVAYISSIGTLILSVVVLLQHGEIDELKTISKTDTSIMQSSNYLLESLKLQTAKVDSEVSLLNLEYSALQENKSISQKALLQLLDQTKSKRIQDEVHLYLSAEALKIMPLGYTDIMYGGYQLARRRLETLDSILISETSNTYLINDSELSTLWKFALKKTDFYKSKVPYTSTGTEQMAWINELQNYRNFMTDFYIRIKQKIISDKEFKTLLMPETEP
jgi:hypothetical protein